VIVADRPFRTLLTREVLRFTRIWVQTLIPSLLTSLLYLVVFGLALGARIKQIEGIPYLEYILPGVALMNLVTGSQMNSSWSVFDAKRERYIDEVLIAPLSDFQIALAYSLGGTLRGVLMGAGVFLVGAPFVGVSIAHPGLLLLIGVLSAFTFSALGTMVGAAFVVKLQVTLDASALPSTSVMAVLSVAVYTVPDASSAAGVQVAAEVGVAHQRLAAPKPPQRVGQEVAHQRAEDLWRLPHRAVPAVR
jgi:ABC-type multidrug transport system permease subunit